MDNELKIWQALVASVRAFADTLEAELGAFAEPVQVSEEEASAKVEPTGNAPAETAPEPQEETPAEPAPKDEAKKAITLQEIRAVLAEKSRAGFTAEVKALLEKHGAEKLSGIAKSEYAALMEEAENLGS